MPRPRRTQLPNTLYHLITRGNNKRTIFLEPADCTHYLDLLFRFKTKLRLLVYHLALMANHVHLLVEPTADETLARFMKYVNQGYSQYFQKKYQVTGHVWQGRYKSIPVETDAYYYQCARYIELNPVRAGIVDHPGDYQWSSYKNSINIERASWIDIHPLLIEMRGEGEEKSYQRFVEDDIAPAKAHKSESFSNRPYYGKTTKFIKRFQI